MNSVMSSMGTYPFASSQPGLGGYHPHPQYTRSHLMSPPPGISATPSTPQGRSPFAIHDLLGLGAMQPQGSGFSSAPMFGSGGDQSMSFHYGYQGFPGTTGSPGVAVGGALPPSDQDFQGGMNSMYQNSWRQSTGFTLPSGFSKEDLTRGTSQGLASTDLSLVPGQEKMGYQLCQTPSGELSYKIS